MSVHVGDVITIADVDPGRPVPASGAPVLCLFGAGHGDGPPGTRPSDWVNYAVVHTGIEQLTVAARDHAARRVLVISTAR